MRRKPESPDRLPPHSAEAERGVLACVLLDPVKSIPNIIARLGPDPGAAMYDLRHEIILSAMVEMCERGTVVDIITLRQELANAKKLEEVGGLAYLGELQDAAPSAANLPYYLDILAEKLIHRKLIRTCVEIVGRAYEEEHAGTLLDSAEKEILAVRQSVNRGVEVTVKDLVKQAIIDFDETYQRQGVPLGIPTGFIDLDKMTDGMQGGHMIVIAGFTGAGKTSFAMNIAEHALLKAGVSAGVFSLEMSALELVKRFICSHARVSMRNLKEGYLSDRDFPKLANSADRVSGSKLFFDDTSGLSIFELRARARRMWQRYQIKLLVVDYLQLLNAEGGSRKVESRQQEMSDVALGVKTLARELGIPVIALSQLNDDGYLRESRAIGHHADDVWVLQASGDTEAFNTPEAVAVDLEIRKQRSGPTGRVHLTFLRPYTRFESAAKISDQDVPPNLPFAD